MQEVVVMDKKFKEYEWANCNINDRIQLLYDKYYNLCVYKVDSLKSLDEATKEECILEAMWHIAKTHEYESINDLRNLLCQIVYNKCCTKLRHGNAKKRGGAVAIYSLEEQFDEDVELDTNLLDVELALFIEQLRPILTKTEYNYVQLILHDTHIPANTEAGLILGVTEGAIRKVKKSLKNKIRS